MGDRPASCPCHSRTARRNRTRWGVSGAEVAFRGRGHDRRYAAWPHHVAFSHEPFRPVQSARRGNVPATPETRHDPRGVPAP